MFVNLSEPTIFFDITASPSFMISMSTFSGITSPVLGTDLLSEFDDSSVTSPSISSTFAKAPLCAHRIRLQLIATKSNDFWLLFVLLLQEHFTPQIWSEFVLSLNLMEQLVRPLGLHRWSFYHPFFWFMKNNSIDFPLHRKNVQIKLNCEAMSSLLRLLWNTKSISPC